MPSVLQIRKNIWQGDVLVFLLKVRIKKYIPGQNIH